MTRELFPVKFGWLGDHLKESSHRQSVAKTTLIRILLCLQIGQLIELIHPKYKYKYSSKQIADGVKKGAFKKMRRDERNKLIHDIFHQTRKAIDYYNAKLKASEFGKI